MWGDGAVWSLRRPPHAGSMPGEAPPAWARDVLMDAGLVARTDSLAARRLGGGVSSDVLLVEDTKSRSRWVIKRPHAHFQVADEWTVPIERALAEAEATRLFMTHLPPGSVAPLLHAHEGPAGPILVFQAAPPEWISWKVRLLEGEVDPEVARAAGALLARIHAIGKQLPAKEMRHDDLFIAQRIEPYLVTSAHRAPPARRALRRLGEAFFEHDDLVHGDYSPKNMLVPPQTDGGPMLIDHEVVTRGDGGFDLAFLWTHLALKSIHRPQDQQALFACAQSAHEAYLANSPDDEQAPRIVQRAHEWVGALLLARAIGKSPAEYLSTSNRARLVTVALTLLHDPPNTLDKVWDRLPLNMTSSHH